MTKQGTRDPWKHRFCNWTGEETARSWDRDAGWREPEPSPRVLYDLNWLDLQPEALADLLALIEETPHLTWCLFSERPGEWAGKLRKAHSLMARELATYTDSAVAMVGHWLRDLAPTPPNVYVGTTVTTQDEADERISDLLSIPARVRVLRVSPREPLDLALAHPSQQHDERSALDGIGWVVCEGGDSPMHPEWVRSLRDQCEEAGVPFWFSGWGEWRPGLPEDCGMDQRLVEVQSVHARSRGRLRDILLSAGSSSHPMARVGKDKAGRLLDGRTWDGVPS